MNDVAEYVFGIHAVNAVVRQHSSTAVTVEKVWVLAGRSDRRMSELVTLARQNGVHIESSSREQLDLLTQGARHQGVVARVVREMGQGVDVSLESILARDEPELLLLFLDGVQDPHNLGACLRTADAAGAHALIIPKDRAVTMNPTVKKVACGAAEVVPLIQVTNLAATLRQVQQSGVWVTGLTGDASTLIYDIDLKGRVGLVMGSEGEGLRRLTREKCDGLAKIPMMGSVESLNVSVAVGVCLYETLRQRAPKG